MGRDLINVPVDYSCIHTLLILSLEERDVFQTKHLRH